MWIAKCSLHLAENAHTHTNTYWPVMDFQNDSSSFKALFECISWCLHTLQASPSEPAVVPVNCMRVNESVQPLNNCSSVSWGEAFPNDGLANCSAEPYTGNVCRQQLLAWQECAVGGSEDVLLDMTLVELTQVERERDAAQFLHFLCELSWSDDSVQFWEIVTFGPCSGNFGSDHCQRAAGFLVCQSYFPLCDECQSGNVYLASRQDCERISMVECEEEWESAKEYRIPLPNCTDLPEQVMGKN